MKKRVYVTKMILFIFSECLIYSLYNIFSQTCEHVLVLKINEKSIQNILKKKKRDGNKNQVIEIFLRTEIFEK